MRQFKPALRFAVIVIFIATLTSCAAERAAKKEKNMDMATNAYQMGTVHFVDGRYVEALKSLTRAVELAPEKAEFHNALALTYGARGLHDLAIEHFSKAISLDPMLSEAYVNLGALYLSNEDWDKAIEASKGALKNVFYKTPEFAHNNIAWGLLNKGDHDGAIEHLTKAIELNPKYKWGYNNLGLALERAGKDDEALRAYQSAVNIDKKFAAAYLNMGVVLKRNDDKAAAENALNKVIEAAPDSPWALSAERLLEELRKD